MASVSGLRDCAAGHLADYVDPGGPRAFQVYDRQGDPMDLVPTDLLAPALLDARVAGRDVIAMHAPSGPHRELLRTMRALIGDRDALDALFVDQDLDKVDGPWGLVRDVLRASDAASGFAAAKVTKILHRKRPYLVPIFDSKVAGFYGVSARRPWELWPLLQTDVRRHGPWLADTAAPHRTPDDREIPLLRVLDIVVWEHVITGCTDGEV